MAERTRLRARNRLDELKTHAQAFPIVSKGARRPAVRHFRTGRVPTAFRVFRTLRTVKIGVQQGLYGFHYGLAATACRAKLKGYTAPVGLRVIGTSQSKKTIQLPDGTSEEDLKAVRAFFAQNVAEPIDKEQVRQVILEGKRRKFNMGLMVQVSKVDYGIGFSFKQLKGNPAAPGQATEEKTSETAPKKTESAVKGAVEKEITDEAVTKIREAMATGKGVEDALGPYARLYGFDNTTQYIIGMFDFWSTWHDSVEQLVEQNAAYKWALRELSRKLTPEGLKALEDVAIRDVSHSLLIAAAQTGNYPPPETLREYIKVIKEEMKQ